MTNQFYPKTIYILNDNWYSGYVEDSHEYKKVPRKRTLNQNNSLHLWLTQVADLLNGVGHTRVNEMGIPSIYTMELLKNDYWKPLQKQLFDIESTTEMTGTILNNLIDSFTLWLAESKGTKAPPFPNKQELLNKLEKEGKLK